MRFDIDKILQSKDLLSGEGKKIVIVPHTNADGDAMGASLALRRVLKKAGHRPEIVSVTDYPDYLKWVEGSSDVVIADWEPNRANHFIEGAELIFLLDFNDLKRTNYLQEKIESNPCPRIMIDHHPFPYEVADVIFSDTNASSTCELIFDFITEVGFGEHLDKESGESIFMGIVTDTGSFSYNSSNPQTYNVVGGLMALGVDKDYIHSRIFHQQSESRLRLLGFALNEKMEYLPDFHTAIISLTKEELERYSFQSGDTEGIVNFPLSIKGTVFTTLFSEKDGVVKISFRSKGDFPANQVAEKFFNGGGHTNAAGGRIDGLTMDEAIQKLKDGLPEFHELLKTESNKLTN